jgi:hypothetical protein
MGSSRAFKLENRESAWEINLNYLQTTVPGTVSTAVYEKDVSVSVYENEIPAFAEAELIRLYSNLFSTLPQLMVRDISSTSTYVASDGMETKDIFLFEKKGVMVRILNEGIRIDGRGIGRFANCIFSRYPSVKVISLHAVEGKIDVRALPCQQHPVLVDIVLAMPRTAEDYLASLGKSTRSYLNRYLNKIRRECPTFSHHVYVKDEIAESDIHDLIDIHRARMASKDKVSIIDDTRLQEIFHLIKKFGFVVIMRIDGRICAGTINYRVGDNYFLETVAHDSNYNDYRIGTICSYLTVCECIARHGKEYHFLWGEYDYKFRLGGAKRELNDLYLYRSRAQLLFNSDFALKVASMGSIHHMKKWLQHEASQHGTLTSRIAAVALTTLQKIKRNLPF